MVSTSNAIESRGGIVWKRVLMSIRKFISRWGIEDLKKQYVIICMLVTLIFGGVFTLVQYNRSYKTSPKYVLSLMEKNFSGNPLLYTYACQYVLKGQQNRICYNVNTPNTTTIFVLKGQ